jgi:hypothetical protein
VRVDNKEAGTFCQSGILSLLVNTPWPIRSFKLPPLLYRTVSSNSLPCSSFEQPSQASSYHIGRACPFQPQGHLPYIYWSIPSIKPSSYILILTLSNAVPCREPGTKEVSGERLKDRSRITYGSGPVQNAPRASGQ